MRPDILLIDADNTLFDFSAAERRSLGVLFAEKGVPFDEEILARYRRFNNALWGDYEKGHIGIEKIASDRFPMYCRQEGIPDSGEGWEERYLFLLSECSELIGGVRETVQLLSSCCRLFIITNGFNSIQLKRFRNSGILDFFEDIFVSETIGYRKPSAEYFRHVEKSIRDFSKERALVIGDSLRADIKGGRDAGIRTCWVSRTPPQVPDIVPDYTVPSFDRVPGLLETIN